MAASPRDRTPRPRAPPPRIGRRVRRAVPVGPGGRPGNAATGDPVIVRLALARNSFVVEYRLSVYPKLRISSSFQTVASETTFTLKSLSTSTQQRAAHEYATRRQT